MSSGNEPPAGGSQFLSLQSASYPVVLAILTGLRVADAPLWLIIVLGALGALTILGADLVKTEMPKPFRWWFARISIWAFNTVVVIASVLFLGPNGA